MPGRRSRREVGVGSAPTHNLCGPAKPIGSWIPYRVVLCDPTVAEVRGKSAAVMTPDCGPIYGFAMADGASPDSSQWFLRLSHHPQRPYPQDLEGGARSEATPLLRCAVSQDDPGASNHAPPRGVGLRRTTLTAYRVARKLVIPTGRAVPVPGTTPPFRTPLSATDWGKGEFDWRRPSPP